MNQKTSIQAGDARQSGEAELDLAFYWELLQEHRIFILALPFIMGVFTYLTVSLVQPTYQADALMQIEQTGKSAAGLGGLEAMMGSSGVASSSTEIEILRSRKVVGDVVKNLNLTTVIQPHYFPVIGEYKARNYQGLKPADAFMGADSYAWGGELIQVDRLELEGNAQGKPLTLVAGAEGRYKLLDAAGNEVLKGTVGKAAASEDGDVSLFISRLTARKGTEFDLYKLTTASVIAGLQAGIGIIEKGRATGILQITLQGTDRERIKAIVHELTQSYMRQNVERKSEESEKMLQFVDSQIPMLKGQLDSAERALNQYREEKGTVDLSYESQNLIGSITRIESQISELQIEEAALSSRLTADHPDIRSIRDKLRHLQGQKAELGDRLQLLPETELESMKYNRDVQVAKELYMLLLNKSQELKLAKAGTIGNARVIDTAVVGQYPVKPDKLKTTMIFMFLGLALAIVIVVFRRILNRAVYDPSNIEKELGYPVYAEIPCSEVQIEMEKRKRKNNDDKLELLAHNNVDTHVIESLRSLRTSIQFAMMEADNNIIAISGPAPNIGKSFVSANFAYIMAESGKRVLLVDGDMRKGHINNYFGLNREQGLSELITGSITLEQAVYKECLHPNLHVITSGSYPPNPSELLLTEQFKAFMQQAQQEYDLVVIDTPPILAVTDAAIIGLQAAVNFLVLRSGMHQMREIEVAIRRFEQNGVNIKGCIFNGVEMRNGSSQGKGNGYKYYAYQYSYESDDKTG